MTELKDIASVAGKGGLFRVIKPGRTSVILESMDEKRTKMVATTHHKVSVLSEISIYTKTDEGSVPLEDVLRKIYKEFDDDPGIDSKSSNEELMSFIEYIVPDFAPDRVYPSDVKKLINWYNILLREGKEWFETEGKKDKDENSKKDTGDTKEKKEKGK